MIDFIIDVVTLGAAIFIGTMAVDWYRKKKM